MALQEDTGRCDDFKLTFVLIRELIYSLSEPNFATLDVVGTVVENIGKLRGCIDTSYL